MQSVQKNSNPYCLVIGSGSGGLTIAVGLAKSGKNVVVVERGHIGGDCTNTGCIPSKALIHASKSCCSSISKQKISPNKKLSSNSNLKQNLPPLDYVRTVRQKIRDEESPAVLEKEYGMNIVAGTASFIDNQTIKVVSSDPKIKDKIFKPQRVVISTGSRSRPFDIPGLPKNKYQTNETIFELKKLPKKLVVIGAGPIACELGQSFAKLGVEVHLLYRKYGILSREDEASSATVMKSMKADGVIFHWNVSDIHYKNKELIFKTNFNFGKNIGKKTQDNLDNKTLVNKSNNTIKAEKISDPDGVLVAIGRVPNIEKLNLDSTEIEYDESGIQTDERYKTSVNNVYAIGDVIHGPNFTHVANAQGRSVLLSMLVKFLPQKDIIKPLPAVTFTNPEVATVGMTLDELANLNPRIVDKIEVPIASIDRAKTDDIKTGHIIIWAEKLTGKIFRATIVADSAGEMISLLTLAIKSKISLWKISKIIIPYPVLSAGIKKAGDVFVVQTLGRLKTDIPLVLKIKVNDFFGKYGIRLVAAIFWLAIFLLSRNYMSTNELTFFDLTNRMSTHLRSSSFGPLLYFIAYFIRPFVLFPATLLAIMAGYVFGIQYGYVYGLFAGVLSAIPFYYIGRFSKQDRDQAKGVFKSYLKSVSKKPFSTVLIMRLLYLPYDLVSFVSGRYGAPLSKFLLATFLSNLVGTFSYVALGASIEGELRPGSIHINPVYFLISIGMLFTSIIISKIISKKSR